MQVVFGKEEQFRDTAVHNLVVVCSPTQSQEFGVHVDIVATSWRENVDLVETEDDGARNCAELRLLFYEVVEGLRSADLLAILDIGLFRSSIRPAVLGLSTRDVKADLNHLIGSTSGLLFILCGELQGDLGTASDVRVGDLRKWKLECGLVRDEECKVLAWRPESAGG